MPPTRDAQATRNRILAAAVTEFAAHGLAGGRVDRIAATAQANKRALYEYFGDKTALFIAAQTHLVQDLTSSVPLTAQDLPGYAGRLFDYHVARPEALRMDSWRQLELRDSPDGVDTGLYLQQLRDVETRPGADDGLPALDLSIFVFAMAKAWFLAYEPYLDAAGAERSAAAQRARHRASLVEAVRRISA